MNKHITSSMVQCTLLFNTIEAAKNFADKYNLQVCEVYITDDNTIRFRIWN